MTTQRRRRSSATSSTSRLGQRRGDPRALDLGRERRAAGYRAGDEPRRSAGTRTTARSAPGRGARGLGDGVERVGRVCAGRAGQRRRRALSVRACECPEPWRHPPVRLKGSGLRTTMVVHGRACPAARGRAPRRRRSIPAPSTARITSTAPGATRRSSTGGRLGWRTPASGSSSGLLLLGCLVLAVTVWGEITKLFGLYGLELGSTGRSPGLYAHCELLPGIRCRTSGSAASSREMSPRSRSRRSGTRPRTCTPADQRSHRRLDPHVDSGCHLDPLVR